MKSQKNCINSRNLIFMLTYFFTLNLNNVWAYTPPIGIPNPKVNWETLDPIEQATPETAEKCPNWPNSATPGCYFYNPEHPDSTDTSNPFGYPQKPRKTMAQGTYAAGTYMFIGGMLNTATINLLFNCTAENPCWITSNTQNQGGFTGNGRISLQTSSYLFIENLLIADKPVNYSASAISISNTPNTTTSTHNISVRNNTVRNIEYTSPDSAFSVTSRNGGTSHDIVIYNNSFTNIGAPDDTVDRDLHSLGISINDLIVGTETYNVWVLNNIFKDSTQGLQINARANGKERLHHVYVGFNYGEHERQRSLSTKQATHVIFSQNEVIPGVNQAAGGYSEGMGWSLGADYIWFLFNNIHNGSDGFRNSDSTGGTSATSRVFIIGNIVHDLSLNPYVTLAGRLGNAVNLEKGASTIHVVDNTFNNILAGIKTEQADTVLYAHGNIFNKIAPGYSFINLYTNIVLSDRHMNNNLYYDPSGNPRWNYTSSMYNSFTAWNTAYPQLNVDSIYANPLIIDEINKNYAVAEGSPAIGANKNESTEYGYPDVYALFETLYGINIRVDYNGNPRPSAGAWTLGAFESGTLKNTNLPSPSAPNASIIK